MSIYYKRFALAGDGYEITPDEYRALRERVRADLADGRAARYFGDPAAQKRAGELFKDQGVAAPPPPGLDGLKRSARDYYSRIAAAELFSERMGALGKDRRDYKADVRLRNQAVQKAAFSFATTEFGQDPDHFSDSMNEMTAAFSMREAGRQMALGKSPAAISKMLPALDQKIAPGREVLGQDVRWYRHDCPATTNLTEHLEQRGNELSQSQRTFALENGLIEGQGLEADYTETIAKISKSAALAASIAVTAEDGSREQQRADRIMDTAITQIKRTAQVAALRDHGAADSSRLTQTGQLLGEVTEQLQTESPEVAAVFDQLQSAFTNAYRDFDTEATIEAASLDKREASLQLYSQKLWDLAAQQSDSLREQDEVDAGQFTPEAPSFRPTPDFMKTDRSGDPELVKDREYFRRLDMSMDELKALSTDELAEIMMHKADLQASMWNKITELEQIARHERELTGRRPTDDWERLEQILTGRGGPTLEDAVDMKRMGFDIAQPVMSEIRAASRTKTRKLDRDHEPTPAMTPSI